MNAFRWLVPLLASWVGGVACSHESPVFSGESDAVVGEERYDGAEHIALVVGDEITQPGSSQGDQDILSPPLGSRRPMQALGDELALRVTPRFANHEKGRRVLVPNNNSAQGIVKEMCLQAAALRELERTARGNQENPNQTYTPLRIEFVLVTQGSKSCNAAQAVVELYGQNAKTTRQHILATCREYGGPGEADLCSEGDDQLPFSVTGVMALEPNCTQENAFVLAPKEGEETATTPTKATWPASVPVWARVPNVATIDPQLKELWPERTTFPDPVGESSGSMRALLQRWQSLRMGQQATEELVGDGLRFASQQAGWPLPDWAQLEPMPSTWQGFAIVTTTTELLRTMWLMGVGWVDLTRLFDVERIQRNTGLMSQSTISGWFRTVPGPGKRLWYGSINVRKELQDTPRLLARESQQSRDDLTKIPRFLWGLVGPDGEDKQGASPSVPLSSPIPIGYKTNPQGATGEKQGKTDTTTFRRKNLQCLRQAFRPFTNGLGAYPNWKVSQPGQGVSTTDEPQPRFMSLANWVRVIGQSYELDPAVRWEELGQNQRKNYSKGVVKLWSSSGHFLAIDPESPVSPGQEDVTTRDLIKAATHIRSAGQLWMLFSYALAATYLGEASGQNAREQKVTAVLRSALHELLAPGGAYRFNVNFPPKSNGQSSPATTTPEGEPEDDGPSEINAFFEEIVFGRQPISKHADNSDKKAELEALRQQMSAELWNNQAVIDYLKNPMLGKGFEAMRDHLTRFHPDILVKRLQEEVRRQRGDANFTLPDSSEGDAHRMALPSFCK